MWKGSLWIRGCVSFLVVAAAAPSGLPVCLAAEPVPRPNFLIIVSDDQRAGTMDFMPLTKQRIFDQGIVFTNAFVTTPLCAPSRASILTGMYAHRHGVRTNDDSLVLPTVIDRLHDAGYFTGLVGKYLNSWSGTPRAEFDFWVSFPGGAEPYVNPTLYVGDQLVQFTGYQTDILRDYGLQFLQAASEQGRPFVLLFTPFAPHVPATPAAEDRSLYPNLPAYRPPNFNEADVWDKPFWLRLLLPFTPFDTFRVDGTRRNQMRCVASLDRAVESLARDLERRGLLEGTVLVYLSDNGVYWGEHRLESKSRVYEEAVRVPFAIRFLPLVASPRVETVLVANIDLAPTLYELAGLPVPSDVSGLSLVPLLTSGAAWREDLMLEGWVVPNYSAVRTETKVYVETRYDLPELYDLTSDPYELRNQFFNRAYASEIPVFHSRLGVLRTK